MREAATAEVTARRLARSHLLRAAPPGDLVRVVSEVGLVQAQVLSAAELGICLRVDGITAADVRRELYERRTLVKTWSIRGTLHLVPSDEAPLWAAAARGPEPYWESPEWLRRHELTAESAAALFEAIADALDGRCLTRAELAAAVEQRLGRSRRQLGSAWGELLHPPALLGTLCFGPPRGANVTFVRADQWLGGWRDADPAAARREVLRRYLSAYGPASADDFRRWSGFGRDEAGALFAEAAGVLEDVRMEDRRAWLLRGDDAGFDADPTSVHLLPRYDAFVLGFRPREALVPERVRARIRADPKGRWETVTGVSPLLVDGVVTGIWRLEKGRRGTRVEVERVLPLRRGRTGELRAAVDRVRQILG